METETTDMNEMTLPADVSGEAGTEETYVMPAESTDALEQIRAMAPDAVEKMRQMLNGKDATSANVLKIIEIILDRSYGKSAAASKKTSVTQTVTQSLDYLEGLVAEIREELEE